MDETTARRPKSLLTPGLRRLLTVGMVLAAFMLANTAYLVLNRYADSADWRFFAIGPSALPKLFQAMVLSHTGVGLLLVVLMALFAALHLPKVWKRYHRGAAATGVIFVAAGGTLAVTGWFIRTAGATVANNWAWWTHVTCAAIVPLGYVAHRSISHVRPLGADYRRFGLAMASILIALVVGHSFTHRDIEMTHEARLAQDKGMQHGAGAKARVVKQFATDPFSSAAFVPVGFVPPGSPFFPSASTTTTGDYLPSRIITRGDLGSAEKLAPDFDKYGFVAETRIGADTCQRCHADIVEQWSASAHRFASFNNPFYEATINDMRENATKPNRWVEQHIQHFPDTEGRVGMIKSKWCSSCHDPSLMLAGKMDDPVDRRLPEAQAGLTCLACHAIDQIHNRTGNGAYNIADEQEDPYLFSTAASGSIGAFLHDSAIKAKPTVHKHQMLKPFFRTSEFCSACHKVSLPEPVNNYRWLRGQNDFDAWHDSGVAHNASRTFYLPPAKRECQECHMPREPAPLGDVSAKNGMVRSHRFLAVNTALPFVRGDDDSVKRIEAFLQDDKLSVDIFAIVPEGVEGPIMALNHVKPGLAAGKKVRVDVVVRNRNVGHTFPAGTNDSNEGWIEFSMIDDAGTQLLVSGAVGADGHLDPAAHVYKALIVDKDGQPIHRRNAQDIHVIVYASVIGPGTADVAHYEVEVPEEMAGRSLTFRARLLWRKFDRFYTEFAFKTNPQGFKRFSKTPDLPVTEIEKAEVTLAVGQASVTSGYDGDPAEWMRYNDYGIALLLEGDTRGAEHAFQRVAALQPKRLDGRLNLAKTAVQDGNLEKAYEHLRECEKIEPANARVAWVWGLVLQEEGRYAEAVLAYRRVLEQFPDDRASWRNMGRTYYLDGQYERAIEAFERLLKIDSEDRIAYYHLMLSYKALGRAEDAQTAEAAYEFYQIDESAQAITQNFRLNDAGSNLETQPIHTHLLTPAGVGGSMAHSHRLHP